MEIYIARDGRRFGPYTLEVIEELLAARTVTGDDHAWVPGRNEWRPLWIVLEELEGRTTPRTQADESPGPAAEPVPTPAATESGPEPVETLPIAADAPLAEAPTKPGASISLRAVGMAVGAFLFTLIVLVAALKPKHVSFDLNAANGLRADPGYTWVDGNNAFDWRVKWTPGTPHPSAAHVVAAAEPGQWQPEPGYELTSSGNLDAAWVPNKREAGFPHVVAGSVPGTWVSDPGYDLTNYASANAPFATWKAGLRDDVRFPHLESGEAENSWRADPGYELAPDSTALQPRAVWTPGTRSGRHPHVYAAAREGSWSADSGYAWVKPADASDLQTFALGGTTQLWSTISDVDIIISRSQCESSADIQAAFADARDRYGNVDLSDAHPLLQQHVRTVYATLKESHSTIDNCRTVDSAQGATDWIIAGACLFADDYQSCLDEARLARGLGKAIEGGSSFVCKQSLNNLAQRIRELSRERGELHSYLQSQYGLQLRSATTLMACGE